MLCQLQDACYSPVPVPAEPLPVQKASTALRFIALLA